MRVHRKCAIVFVFGLLTALLVAACGQGTTTEKSGATGVPLSSSSEEFVRGNELSQAGKFQEAADEYLKALALDPENVDVLTNLGVAYYNLGKLDEAVEQYAKAVKLAPNDGDIRSNLAAAYVQKYQANGDKDQLNQALQGYKKAVELKPDLAEAHFGLGVVYALLGQNQDAIQALETFQKLDKGKDPLATENAKQYLQQLRGE